MPNRKFVFDFDSTLTSVEGLDVLAEISLRDNPDKENVINKIQEITDLGIDGDISFSDSLSSRIALLKANKSQLQELVDLLKTKLSESVKANKGFFTKYRNTYNNNRICKTYVNHLKQYDTTKRQLNDKCYVDQTFNLKGHTIHIRSSFI